MQFWRFLPGRSQLPMFSWLCHLQILCLYQAIVTRGLCASALSGYLLACQKRLIHPASAPEMLRQTAEHLLHVTWHPSQECND